MEELLKNERHYKINGWVLVNNSHILRRHSPITLKKGNIRIWQIRDGWQVADLVPLFEGAGVFGYRNHRPEKTLVDAIDNNS